jgi:hypothetical protein
MTFALSSVHAPARGRATALLATISLGALGASVACDGVPFDDERNDRRLILPAGVIRGTVTYTGPRPCSKDGHIVGNAIVSVWRRSNPPPPAGVATSPVNFVAVPGDVLFANERPSISPSIDCPPDDAQVTVSSPFAIAPLDAASYIVTAFYDRRGRFFPSFRFRNQPESGDFAGGYFDVEDARKNQAIATYRPIFLPVAVGRPKAGSATDLEIGENGYVADNVAVSIGTRVPWTRPVFHAKGVDRNTGNVVDSAEELPGPNPVGALGTPIVAMTQDAKIFAPPANANLATLAAYQEAFPAIRIAWGVPDAELEAATSPDLPFGLQLPPVPPKGKGGLLVFARGGPIPETELVPQMWPLVTFVKLADDPRRQADPQSLVVQGTPEETIVTGKPRRPIVIVQGIPLVGDSVAKTVVGPVPDGPTTSALVDHATVLVRPAALCFDPRAVDVGGVLVTPYLTGRSSDATETGDKPLFDPAVAARSSLVREVVRGCLPSGRYAMSVVYPNGQSWIVPNESGSCARTEGNINVGVGNPATCSGKPRPVLLSQGVRAVLEIVGPSGTDDVCAAHPVPKACLEL